MTENHYSDRYEVRETTDYDRPIPLLTALYKDGVFVGYFADSGMAEYVKSALCVYDRQTPVLTARCPDCGGIGHYAYQPEHGAAYEARCIHCGGIGAMR